MSDDVKKLRDEWLRVFPALGQYLDYIDAAPHFMQPQEPLVDPIIRGQVRHAIQAARAAEMWREDPERCARNLGFGLALMASAWLCEQAMPHEALARAGMWDRDVPWTSGEQAQRFERIQAQAREVGVSSRAFRDAWRSLLAGEWTSLEKPVSTFVNPPPLWHFRKKGAFGPEPKLRGVSAHTLILDDPLVMVDPVDASDPTSEIVVRVGGDDPVVLMAEFEGMVEMIYSGGVFHASYKRSSLDIQAESALRRFRLRREPRWPSTVNISVHKEERSRG